MANYIFISYATADRAYVEALAAQIEAELALEAWWFQGKQIAGVRYQGELIGRIHDARAVVVVLSPDSAHANGVLAEVSLAEKLEKPLIPIVIGPGDDPSITAHVRLGEVTYILRKLDIIDGRDGRDPLPRLRAALASHLALDSEGAVASVSPSTTASADLQGVTLKGYTFGDLVARTNVSLVYGAHELAVGRAVAIKVILPALAGSEEYRRHFEEEARRIARLEHPYIVRLYNYWSDDSNAYLVMPWMPGGTLADSLTGGRLAVPTVARIFAQVSSALAHAHYHGVIHRDIKPANILLDAAGNAYLSDFGIAHEQTSTAATLKLAFSAGYAPPEQIEGDVASVRSDVYSLAAVLFEMLAGEPAFPGADTSAIIRRQRTEPAPSLADLAHIGGAVALERIDLALRRALARNPADRFPDLASFIATIRAGLYDALRDAGFSPPKAHEIVQPSELASDPSELENDSEQHAEIAGIDLPGRIPWLVVIAVAFLLSIMIIGIGANLGLFKQETQRIGSSPSTTTIVQATNLASSRTSSIALPTATIVKKYRVLVDRRHDDSMVGQRFAEMQLENVEFLPSSTVEFSASMLAKYDLLIIYYSPLAPTLPQFTSQEIDAIKTYIRNGGSVLLIGLGWTWPQYIKKPIDSYPLDQIAEEFGIFFTSGILADKQGGAVIHSITEMNSSHPITRNLKRVGTGKGANPGTFRVSPPAIPIVWGDEQIHETYGLRNPPVVVAAEVEGRARLVAIQHPDYALNYFDNQILIENIVRWLLHQT
jgi:serine/threonine-protein kinase